MSGMNNKQILTPNQVAELMMVSPATVRQWASKGLIKALTTPGGHRRFRMSDIVLFAQKKGVTLNIDDDSESLTSILIAEDDKQFAGYLEELVKSFDDNLRVKVANDGFETGRLIHTFHPNLILMDLMMPMMDGFETCKSIKSDPETAQIQIIAMTGYGSEKNQKRILELGAEDCLLKPIDEDVLEQYIRSIMAR